MRGMRQALVPLRGRPRHRPHAQALAIVHALPRRRAYHSAAERALATQGLATSRLQPRWPVCFIYSLVVTATERRRSAGMAR